MNLRFYKLLEISPVAEKLLAFKEVPLRRAVSHSVKKTGQPCNISSVCAPTLCRRTTCRSHGMTWLGIPDISMNQAGEDSRAGHVRGGYIG